MQNIAGEQYIPEQRVREITGLSLSFLRNNRSMGRGIPYVKIGRSVRYSLDDVVAYMEARKVQTTSC